jgi:hypothetical protein
MDSRQINKVMEHVKMKVFQGCFPCDRLPHPSALNYPAALIVNLDPHGFEGSHWVAIYARGRNKDVYYFDSLNLPILPIINEKFLNHFSKVIRNTKPFQSITSDSCAQHVICFLYFMNSGKTFDRYLHFLDFKSNPDLFVKLFIRKMIK